MLTKVGPGTNVDDSTLRVMVEHLDFVLEANARVNLTAIRTMDEGIRLHVLDSLLALPEVDEAPAGPVVDIGSGGGFPGIPIALATGREVLLVDSVAKKMATVAEFLGATGLSGRVSTSTARAERLGSTNPAGWSVVTARAVSELPALVELASPLLARGARLVALKARVADDELARGDRVAALCGMKRRSDRLVILPDGDEHRRIIVYERVGQPKVRLPRREGLAQHKPLA
jgi:16S rRNA (guanine527-N7)-methyltransferase